MAVPSLTITEEEMEEIMPTEDRVKCSSREKWYCERCCILDRISDIDLETTTEKELMYLQIETNIRLYFEIRKMNEVKK